MAARVTTRRDTALMDSRGTEVFRAQEVRHLSQTFEVARGTRCEGDVLEVDLVARHVVLRRRKTLEEAGLMDRIAVNIHPQGR